MEIAYKYRSNLLVDGENRDTVQLPKNVFYVANLLLENRSGTQRAVLLNISYKREIPKALR